MKYEEEFDSKWGFDDGDATPPDAHQVRTIQTYVFNRVCEGVGCDIRLVPLDRPGMHNYFLWSFRPVADVKAIIDDIGHWRFAEGAETGGYETPEICWEDCRHEDDELLELVLSACNGDGTLPGFEDDIGYLFVNGRNQIRKTAADAWIKRAVAAIKNDSKGKACAQA